jgi:serine protease Do
VVFVQSERPAWTLDMLHGRRLRTSVISGSGVVIDASGYIVTNHHVVGDDARRITVQFDPDLDPTVYEAELVSAAAGDDLALLKIEGDREFAEVRRGTSSDLWIGERVIAIGNPFQQKLSVSTGIISGQHRDLRIEGPDGRTLHFPDLIQTDASINPGNSGGPLLNVLGELVGINTAVNPGAENMGFAIPIDRVEEVLREHLLDPSASKAWLGFEVDDLDSFCVTRVVPGGPAALAGLEEGDRVVSVAGVPLESSNDYRLAILRALPRAPLHLRVAAAGGERDLDLDGWDRVDGVLWERLGMTVEAITIGRARRVRVTKLAAGGPAERLGLRPEDVLDAVRVAPRGQAWSVHGPDALAALVLDRPRGTEVEIDVLRDDDRNGLLERTELYKGVLALE